MNTDDRVEALLGKIYTTVKDEPDSKDMEIAFAALGVVLKADDKEFAEFLDGTISGAHLEGVLLRAAYLWNIDTDTLAPKS